MLTNENIRTLNETKVTADAVDAVFKKLADTIARIPWSTMADTSEKAMKKIATVSTQLDATLQANLDRFVAFHKEKQEEMMKAKERHLYAEEEAAIKRAKAREASEEEIHAIETLYAYKRDRLRQEEYNAEIETLLRVQEERDRIESHWQDKLLQQSGNRKAILEAERDKAIAEAERAGASTLEIEEYYAKERKRIDRALRNEKLKNIQDLLSNVGNVVTRINEAWKWLSNYRRKTNNRDYEEERARIEATVDDENERALQLEELRKDEDAQKLELQKEEVKRQKAVGIFNVIIDTPVAMMRAIRDFGPIVGPTMATAVAGFGLAQLGTIASTPEPFAAGALIRGGRGGVHGLVGEGQENELILPMETGVEKLAAELNARQLTHSPASGNTVTINVGTLIADDRGIKELERRMRQYRIAEDRRTGVNV